MPVSPLLASVQMVLQLCCCQALTNTMHLWSGYRSEALLPPYCFLIGGRCFLRQTQGHAAQNMVANPTRVHKSQSCCYLVAVAAELEALRQDNFCWQSIDGRDTLPAEVFRPHSGIFAQGRQHHSFTTGTREPHLAVVVMSALLAF